MKQHTLSYCVFRKKKNQISKDCPAVWASSVCCDWMECRACDFKASLCCQQITKGILCSPCFTFYVVLLSSPIPSSRGTSTPLKQSGVPLVVFFFLLSTPCSAPRLPPTLTTLQSLQPSIVKTLWQPTSSPFLTSPFGVTPFLQEPNCFETSELFISLFNIVWQVPLINWHQPSLPEGQTSHSKALKKGSRHAGQRRKKNLRMRRLPDAYTVCRRRQMIVLSFGSLYGFLVKSTTSTKKEKKM